MKESKKLKRSLIIAAVAMLAALVSVSAATFAWYIYQTAARTTKVEMAAGSSISLQISNQKDEGFKSSTVMEKFEGELNPVSTTRIVNPGTGTFLGFQRAEQFESRPSGDGDKKRVVVTLFGSAVEKVDYYKTSLYIRTNTDTADVYISNIGFEDLKPEYPISTAMRVGFVSADSEAIFEINPESDPIRADNGHPIYRDGVALDPTKAPGTTVDFSPMTSDNYCNYDIYTGTVTLNPNSWKLCTVKGDGKGGYGEPEKIDVYLWLEGCDMDCSNNLIGQTLKSLALSFAGYTEE